MKDRRAASEYSRSSWSGFRRVEAEFLRPHRSAMALALAGMLAQSMLVLPAPLLQGWVVDRLVPMFADGSFQPPGDGGRLSRMIALALAATVAVHLARMALGWKVASITARVALEAVRELTDALHRKLQRLAMSYFDRHQTGQIMARLTSDVGSLLVFLGGGAVQSLSDLVMAAGIAALMVWLEWRLALACFVVIPLFALNHRVFAGPIRRVSREIRGQVAAIYALLSERISAVRVVRSFAKEDAELADLDSRIDAHRSLAWSSQKAVAAQGAAATMIGGLGSVSVVALGVTLVGRGRMSVGEMLAFYALVAQLYGPILRLAGLQPMIAGTLAAVDRIVEVLDEPELVAARPMSRLRRVKGSLEYRDVSFSYTPGGRRLLDGVDLKIEPGMTLGLLGESGSGKSTLLALAPRIYDLAADGGAILLDGHDVRGLAPAELRRAVALVPQRAMLFGGTIRSNLTYARPDADPKLIRDALEVADLAELVDGLPTGLDTPVGERGQTLSGGQRQRLALARALVADPAVLLLDDCTSALDAETETRIQDALAAHRPGQTRLIVSHKVSSVRDADLIVVLDRGRVVESGAHDELIDRGDLYAGIYRSQTESVRPSSSCSLGRPSCEALSSRSDRRSAGSG